MAYTPITDPLQIKDCHKAFKRQFASRGAIVRRVRPYGYPVPQVRWHEDLGIWSAFGEDWRDGGKGDWFALFGVGKPTPHHSADIALEINVYKQHPTRQMDGRYLTDGNGTLYIGRASTANKGRGISVPIISAAPQWASDVEVVDWGRKKNDTEKVILIGAVDDPKLPERVAALVLTAHAIKSGTKPESIPVPKRTKPTIAAKSPSYSPEFDEDSVYNRTGETVVVKHDHAKIVAALKAELERLGHRVVANDGARDLYVPSNGTDAKILFEVKLSNDTQDIYTAIGQLMFHGACQQVEPSRVLVVPLGAKPETMKTLSKLGIQVVTFTMRKGGRVRFVGLDAIPISEARKTSA